MKSFLSLCIGIIFSGAAYSLYNAAHDYGLATVSLPPAIIAQQDDTSGWGDNTNDGDKKGYYLSGYEMSGFFHEDDIYTDSDGRLEIFDLIKENLIPNTLYHYRVLKKICISSSNPDARCYPSEAKVYILNLNALESGGDSTNGDGTC